MANPPKTQTVSGDDSLLFAEIRQLAEEHKQTTCTIGVLLEQLSDVDRAGLQLALDTPSFTGTAIAEILKRRGLHMSSHTVQRHRRGGCGCPRG